MESFLAFSKKYISASAGVIPLIRKNERYYNAVVFFFLTWRSHNIFHLAPLQVPTEVPKDLYSGGDGGRIPGKWLLAETSQGRPEWECKYPELYQVQNLSLLGPTLKALTSVPGEAGGAGDAHPPSTA